MGRTPREDEELVSVVRWSGGGRGSVVSLLLSRLWLNLVLVWPKKSAGGNFRDNISLEPSPPASALREESRRERREIENREQTGGQGTLARVYGCVPAHNVHWTAHVPNDPPQTEGHAWRHLRVSWNCSTTGSRTQLKGAAPALLRQSQQHKQTKKKR